MRLIHMRHGETEWNAEQRLQGQDNSLLSERGVAQVKRFRPYAKALKPARIIASDLGRTRQTVALIGHPDAPSDERAVIVELLFNTFEFCGLDLESDVDWRRTLDRLERDHDEHATAIRRWAEPDDGNPWLISADLQRLVSRRQARG